MFVRPTFGIGMLCYGRYDTFREALRTYQAAGLFDLADEVLIAFNGLDEAAEDLAGEFGLPHIGSEENLGILGGFKMLAEGMTSDIVLMLENDLPLIESAEEARRQIELARTALAENDVEVFRFRHRLHPGYRDQAAPKFLRYYRPNLLSQIRRLVRPGKAPVSLSNQANANIGETVDYCDRVVCRSIIDNDKLKVIKGLRKQRLQCGADCFGDVVGRNDK